MTCVANDESFLTFFCFWSIEDLNPTNQYGCRWDLLPMIFLTMTCQFHYFMYHLDACWATFMHARGIFDTVWWPSYTWISPLILDHLEDWGSKPWHWCYLTFHTFFYLPCLLFYFIFGWFFHFHQWDGDGILFPCRGIGLPYLSHMTMFS